MLGKDKIQNKQFARIGKIIEGFNKNWYDKEVNLEKQKEDSLND